MKRIPVAFLLAALACGPLIETAADEAAPSLPEPEVAVAGLTTHPRLLVSAGAFDALRARIGTNPVMSSWYAQVKAEADALLGQAVTQWDSGSLSGDDRNFRAAATQIEDRLWVLSFAYRVSGDGRHLARAWKEMDAVARFADWNPSKPLDTAHVLSGMAVGYDWLYASLSSTQRSVIRTAIENKGLKPFAATLGVGSTSPRGWAVHEDSNWNFVCNGAAVLAATAVYESSSLARAVLPAAIAQVRPAFATLGEDGGWHEGVGYWRYSVTYAVNLLATLGAAFGDDEGLSDFAGLSTTGLFPLYFTGPTGKVFNFADSGRTVAPTPQAFWLSSRYGKPLITWSQRRWGARGVESLLFYDPSLDTGEGPAARGLDLDRNFRGVSELVSMRSAWEQPRATWVGFKAGDNGRPHSHLDLGTFVLDALGERWAEDLGNESYGCPGYGTIGPTRWTYYRARAEGHNTLVVNPGSAPDQVPTARAPLHAFVSRSTDAFAVADLTPAYSGKLTRARRGVRLFDQRRRVIVQDELSAGSSAEVWWFMHFAGKSASLSEGGKAVLLQAPSGARLWARILSPSNATFTVRSASPLPTSPDPGCNAENVGMRKLAIRLSTLREATVSVLLAPLEPGEQVPQSLPAVVPLEAW